MSMPRANESVQINLQKFHTTVIYEIEKKKVTNYNNNK